jgi:O-antigen/teichoic acid export membrane protein
MQEVRSDLTPGGAAKRHDVQGIRQVVLRAGSVALGAHVLSQLIRFSGNLILTRLLVPEAFGVMLVSIVVWMGLTLFTDFGLRQVVIRSSRSGDPVFLNTVWTLQILQGMLIATLLVATAGVLSLAASMGLIPHGSTFSSPEVPWVIASLAVPALLQSLESTKMHVASRNLQVSRIAAIELGCQVVALGVTVTFARTVGGVVALVAGAFAASTCRTLATHLAFDGHRNRLAYDAPSAKEVVTFGVPIILTSCLGFIVTNGDKLVLGWVLSAQAMGSYAIAVLLVSALHDAAGKIISQVMYPAISRAVSHDPSSLRANYLSLRATADVGCLIVGGLLVSLGDRVVALLYDGRYAEAGTYVGILGLSLVGIRYRVLNAVLLTIGRPRLQLYEQIFQLTALVPGILLGFRFGGPRGAVWGVALSYLTAQLWNIFYLQRKLGLFSAALEFRGVAIFATAAGLGALLRIWI